MTTAHTPSTLRGLIALGLATAPLACQDDAAGTTTEAAETDTPATGTGDGDTDVLPTTSAGSESGDDGGEPPPPGDQAEDCDAGDEAFVKRLIPLVQGRKPEGMREVLLLVSMIEQLDAAGVDGRAVVARGLASGPLYLGRWRQFLWEQLRINRIEIKSNLNCYSSPTAPTPAPSSPASSATTTPTAATSARSSAWPTCSRAACASTT